MTRRTARLVATIVATAAVTACTTTAGGTPKPGPGDGTSTVPSSSAPTTTKEEAPRVAEPLDAATFTAAPCTTLTPEQLPPFEVKPPGDTRGGEGTSLTPGCSWHGDANHIGVGWLTDNTGGISDTYRRRELDAYFIETTVDGYPAVFVDASDRRAEGYCGIVVGVSDTLTFYATTNTRLGADESCAMAEQVAAAALDTVKAAN